MLSKAKNFLRRQIRGMQRSGQFPLLLPHHTLAETGLKTINGDSIPFAPSPKKALSLCTGQKTLGAIAKEAGVAKSEVIKAQDDGLLLIWRSPVPAAVSESHHHPHSIIVSPHLDDAALSCGGRMLGDQSMLVLNIFSQTAWWRFGHAAEDAGKIQACRKMEEELVARLSGAVMINLDLHEALLRGYTMELLFTATDTPAPSESDFSNADRAASQKIQDAITSLTKEHPLAHWFLPLGIGNHIDHRLARNAAMAALRDQNIKNSHLHFYEDLPYAAKLGPAANFSKHIPNCTLRAEVLDIEEQLAWKLELLRAYWSQFRWSDLAELKTYAIAVGGDAPAEIAWTPV